MIIDLILDRKDGTIILRREEYGGPIVQTTPIYNAKRFYDDIMEYYDIFPEIIEPIAEAMDSGEEEDIKKTLKAYIINEEYDPNICDYIDSVSWL